MKTRIIPVTTSISADGINLESEKNGQKLASISDQHAAADARQLFFHGIFNWHRRDILTPGSDQDF